MNLLVVIVNYRCASLTVSCVNALCSNLPEDVEVHVTVVENHSEDDSEEILKASFAPELSSDLSASTLPVVDLIVSDENLGFAGGNNLAISNYKKNFGLPDYVLLLNPDTLIQPEAIDHLLSLAQSRPEIGMVGGLSENEDGSPQHCFFRFPSVFGEFARYANVGIVDRLLRSKISRLPFVTDARKVDWVSGAFLLIRRSVFEQIGLLDDHYFLYFEETDFLKRASLAGWECWHEPRARVIHFVGQSSGVNEQKSVPPAYWFESRYRYFRTRHGVVYERLTALAAVMGLIIANGRTWLLKGKQGDLSANKFLRATRRARKTVRI